MSTSRKLPKKQVANHLKTTLLDAIRRSGDYRNLQVLMKRSFFFLALCCICFIIGFLYKISLKKCPIIQVIHPSIQATTSEMKFQQATTHGYEEFSALLKMIEWPLPSEDRTIEYSTHPKTSGYFLLNPQSTYVVGQPLKVLITAIDHKGRPKSYGGDLFFAKLHSASLKAGVSGSVMDHKNGSYTATLIPQWSGETEISVKLMHSSEAIAILHQKRDTRPDKVFFKGYYERNGRQEVVECNFELPGQDVCEYYEPRYDEKWVCKRPKHLPCDSYRDHSSGGNRDILSKEEHEFFSEPLRDKEVPSTLGKFHVLPQKNAKNVTVANAKHIKCVPGLKNPDPSGYYYQDAWQSLTCSNQHFDEPTRAAKCLSGKIVYMLGDSTLRQWWEYLTSFIPTLKEIHLHVAHHKTGPLLATDAENDYLVQWRTHQKPLRMERSRAQDLRYIASELDGMGAREGLVIVLTCGNHFLTYPVGLFVRRLYHIREAVSRLLERSPETKILIKSANTGYRFDHGSDWLSLQLDTIMRAMFSKLPVTILDVWQMTSCHREPEDLHPPTIIVKNEVDLMLSFICPQ
ncbi:NXPE family member 3-like isoform X2 [Hyperolius riggenbachi]|uniref:NXPE family member 3-like isoform X2 n=1 Tax=Hyperolius riggenbachi TaxID=752182 RepID=UPI0035A38C24